MNEQPLKPWLEGVLGTQVLPIINCDDETIRVEAGPGTGKTFGLVRRVQRLLHPDGLAVPSSEVLVVAFNRVIAKQLREDIEKCLRTTSDCELPVIRTVHALCLQLLGSDLRILLPHEREAMIYDVICTYPQMCQDFVTRPNEKICPKVDQALRDHEANHERHEKLWQAVTQWLVQHKARLISELPNIVRVRIQGGDFQEETFQHVIVDEFQDLTPGEQQLFLELKKREGSFMALGDPRQSIYAFRGNDRKGLKKLDRVVPTSRVSVRDITMTECRRCPKQIAEAANQLMELYEAKPLVPVSEERDNIHLVLWKSYQAEAEGMAKTIVDNIRAYPQEKHLAMVTRRQFGFKLRDHLHALDNKLSIELNFSESLLESWPVRESFLFFCLLVDPDAPTWRAWFAYRNSCNGKGYKATKRNAAAYLKFLHSCNDEITEASVEQLAASPKQPPGGGGKNLRERARRFVILKKQLGWDGIDALTLLEEIFNLSSWDENTLDDLETASLDMDLFRSRACEICRDIRTEKADSTAQQQLKEVAKQLRYHIATREPFESVGKTDLMITTLWGAKGITASHVYVLGLCDEAIPGEMREEYPGTLLDYREEQKRLFYVSITRARKSLVLSRAQYMRRGDFARLGLGRSTGKKIVKLRMSQFLHDIIDFLPRSQNGDDWQGIFGPTE